MKWTAMCLLFFACCGAFAAEKPRVAVFDLVTTDIAGQRFLEQKDQTKEFAPIRVLTPEELSVIDGRALGFVKTMEVRADAADREREQNRLDWRNARDYARKQELAQTMLQGGQRPAVIGSEYLIAALGAYPDALAVVDPARVRQILAELDPAAADAVQRVQAGGVTYILYGTVSDFAVKEQRFDLPGVPGVTRTASVDVMVKLVRLADGEVVSAGLYTGQIRESGDTVRNDYYAAALKDGLKQAAAGIAAALLPERYAAPAATVAASARKTLAVLPATGMRGVSSTDLDGKISRFFLNDGKCDLVSRTDLDRVVAESHLPDYSLAAPGQLSRVGELLVADYLILPTVTRFESEQIASGTAIAGSSVRQLATMTLQLRVLEVKTGRVIADFAETVRLRSSDIPAADRRDWTARDWQNALFDRAVAAVAPQVLGRIAPESVPPAKSEPPKPADPPPAYPMAK